MSNGPKHGIISLAVISASWSTFDPFSSFMIACWISFPTPYTWSCISSQPFNHLGPSHYNLLLTNLPRYVPLLAISAKFSSDLTFLILTLYLSYFINNKSFQFFSWLVTIQANTCLCLIGLINSPQNSSSDQVSDISLMGEIQFFAKIKFIVFISLSLIFRYTTATYANLEASVNVKSS